MTSSKGTTAAAAAQPTHECCMCGDFGFSYELFQCKVCQYRSQHRYCSNLYPNAESYRICNWCLTQKEDTKEKSQNSSNSSSSCRKEGQDHDPTKINKKKNSSKTSDHQSKHGHGGGNSYGGLRGKMQLQPSGPIKKQRSIDLHHNHQGFGSPSPSPSPKSPSTRKRILTNGQKEAEKIRRTRSEEMSNLNNGIITRQVFRNKVRRYKLLDEVSSQ